MTMPQESREPYVNPVEMERRFGTLEASVQRIEQKVDDGFRGVHQRQDVQNGRLAGGESRLDALEREERERDAREAYLRGKTDAKMDVLITKSSWKALVAIISGVSVLAGGISALATFLVRLGTA